MEHIFILLAAFQLKHFIADYPLQTPYMYLNKGAKTDWVLPLSAHAVVHTGLTMLIIGGYSLNVVPMTLGLFLALSAFDFTTHFLTDRWKATRGVGPDTHAFWIHLGIDQMLHHVVGIIIIYWVVT